MELIHTWWAAGALGTFPQISLRDNGSLQSSVCALNPPASQAHTRQLSPHTNKQTETYIWLFNGALWLFIFCHCYIIFMQRKHTSPTFSSNFCNKQKNTVIYNLNCNAYYIYFWLFKFFTKTHWITVFVLNLFVSLHCIEIIIKI